MNKYLQIVYIVFASILALVSGALWSLYAFDVVNIGWGQPLMVTVLLVVFVGGFILIQASSPSAAEVLKARLEFQQAEVAKEHMASLRAFRGQERNSEEDELRAAIEWAAKDLGFDK